MSVGSAPSAPFAHDYLSAWTVAWLPDALIVAATLAYLMLLRRDRRQPVRRRWSALAAWVAAMVCLVIAFNSSIGIYSDALFWVHMIQHLTLIMVVPPLLVWADPWALIPARGGTRTLADVLGDSRPWRAVINPLISVPLYAAAVVLTHLTSFQQIAVGHPPTRTAENVGYLVVGYVLFAPLVAIGGGARRMPDLIRFVVLAAAMGVDTLTGVSLMMTSTSLAPAYAAGHPGWGPGALTDQHTAGALMWFVGDAVMMLLMIAVAVAWGLRRQDLGMGDWLEGIRRRQLLGEALTGADTPDVDEDQAALDAYNAYLAMLQREGGEHRAPG
jgi:putative copper resistance protein D